MGQLDIGRTILTTFFNDSLLKDYMGISVSDKNKIVEFRDKYCCNIFNSDALVINDISRLVYRNLNLSSTNNPQVKIDSLMIDIYVKASEEYTVDPVDRLKRRQDVIYKRILELLNNQSICGFKFRLVDKGDLYSGVLNYHRYFLKFEYKFIG